MKLRLSSDLHTAPPPDEAAILEAVDCFRLEASLKTAADRKAALGQFLTPLPVAQLMAGMLQAPDSAIRILDPGAGVGSLFAACVVELCRRPVRPASISVTAYEIDESLTKYIAETFARCRAACRQVGIDFEGEVIQTDFIAGAVDILLNPLFTIGLRKPYNCVILNPPYSKISSQSKARRLLHQIGIETSNLYTGFLFAAMQLLQPQGELVAITPRSFCNGPYFRPFRESFLRTMALDRLHLFESRTQPFQEDRVLQENLIMHAVKGGPPPATVLLTSSAGADDDLFSAYEAPYPQVVHPGDPESFIRIVADDAGRQVADRLAGLHCSLADLGLSVSTGPVVDFRSKTYLRAQPEPGTAPLIFPMHLAQGYVQWPKPDARKPNAIHIAAPTQPLLVPNEHYVLVKRFSAKEEQKRIVAAVYDAGRVAGARVSFENHLNYFHRQGRGLGLPLARGLAAFLNWTLVDTYFRQFNGHTQVNATDLRNLRYPSLSQLEAIGTQIPPVFPVQPELDALVEKELLTVLEPAPPDARRIQTRIAEARAILKDLGLPRQQQNERSALTLLALLDLAPATPWAQARDPLIGITPMMEFFAAHYGKTYKPNTRETVRRQTVHQFLEAGIIVENPDQQRPPNSPAYVYQVEQSALGLFRTYGTPAWEQNLRAFLASMETLAQRNAQDREQARIPVTVAPGTIITLSPGGQNVLVEKIVHDFAARFTPGGRLLYVGDTDKKFAYLDDDALATLGIHIAAHGKMPDVIIHHVAKNWLVLIEAVTSHGPVDPKRKRELEQLFRESRAGLILVTAFLTRKVMVEYLGSLAWETEVWIAESPSHMIHFNGERFLEPY